MTGPKPTTRSPEGIHADRGGEAAVVGRIDDSVVWALRRKRLLGAGLAVALAVYVVSCSSSPVADYASTHEHSVLMTERASGLRVGPLDESGAVSADAFWPERRGADTFIEFANDSADGGARVERRFVFLDDGSVRVEVVRDETTVNEIERRSDGAVVARLNNGAEIRSVFAPSALVFVDGLGAGEAAVEPFEVTSTVPVIGETDGKGEAAVRGIGMQAVETPAGVFDAFVVESSLVFMVGPAKISLKQRAWVDVRPDGLGIVAEEGVEKVWVFGMPRHDRERVAVLERAGLGLD